MKTTFTVVIHTTHRSEKEKTTVSTQGTLRSKDYPDLNSFFEAIKGDMVRSLCDYAPEEADNA
jgi:hypothetical protein